MRTPYTSLILCLTLLITCSCAEPAKPRQESYDPIAALIPSEPSPTLPPPAPAEGTPLKSMGYSIQVGAFSNLDNAVRLERQLEQKGIDAYYFRHESGLYKVRFGDHSSYAPARAEAERLQRLGLIDSFFIVIPEDYAAARIAKSGKGDLRGELVKTARRFIGVPYRWGGENTAGFDCSGLTMVCYRLNGLNLPRNSRSQYKTGRWIPKAQLKPGDLVFFATKGGSRVTHVGMYIGNNQFIHAPRTGQKVRIEKLSNRFFAKTFVGGRSYL